MPNGGWTPDGRHEHMAGSFADEMVVVDEEQFRSLPAR